VDHRRLVRGDWTRIRRDLDAAANALWSSRPT
jgi:hypothetical protein